MFTTHRKTASAAVFVSMLTVYLWTALSASAMPPDPQDDSYSVTPPVNAGGHHSSAWTYVVVAVVAALVTLALCIVAAKLRRTHRSPVAAAA